MKHRSLTSDPPAVGDPVVFGGVKHRIRSIGETGVLLHDRFAKAASDPVVLIKSLYWDPLPGVWRVG